MDQTGFAKKGSGSAGVQRQYTGSSNFPRVSSTMALRSPDAGTLTRPSKGRQPKRPAGETDGPSRHLGADSQRLSVLVPEVHTQQYG
ncbi:hypothetical protein GCM10010307_27810 [Streptomyces vastus]|uniref:Uncharacterized protein n=1 Tax=Streptomyces vastus TaxID=285451 RepID=A0ABP6D1S0_9ACTN